MIPVNALGVALALFGAAASPAMASVRPAPAPLVGDASGAAQFYVLSFTDAPIAEVAEDVVGGALARSVAVDPAVDGVMSFRVEGWFSPEALLQEFGAALLDQEVALVRSRQGDLALVPRPNLAPELAAGGVLIAIPQTATAPPPPPGSPRPPVVYGRDRWGEGALGLLLVFLAGCGAGAAALLGGQTARRRAEARRLTLANPPMLRLIHDPRSAAERSTVDNDPGLTIPRFDRSEPPV